MGEHERKPQVYYVDLSNSWNTDPQMSAWAQEFLTAFLAMQDLEINTGPRLDAQMQGEDIPDILQLILNARG